MPVEVTDKSPLHPSALTVSDLRIGLEIIRFHVANGIEGEYTVVSEPFPAMKSERNIAQHFPPLTPVVTLQDASGYREDYHLGDLGVEPYLPDEDWNTTNFVVRAEERHSLPNPDPSQDPYFSIWDVPMASLEDPLMGRGSLVEQRETEAYLAAHTPSSSPLYLRGETR